MRLRTLLSTGLLLVAGSGCASLSTVHTAHALRPGETKITANTSLVGGGVPGLTFGAVDATREQPLSDLGVPIPQAELEVRHGFAPRFDAGLRVFLLGAGGDVKFQFLQREKWDAAFVPGVSGSYINFSNAEVRRRFGEIDVSAPVLFGRHIGQNSSFVIGPKVQGRYTMNSVETPEVQGRGSRFIFLAGGTGVLNLWMGSHFSVPLELTVMRDWTESTGYAYSTGIGLALSTRTKPLRNGDDD
jgi:hypothetical protein